MDVIIHNKSLLRLHIKAEEILVETYKQQSQEKFNC